MNISISQYVGKWSASTEWDTIKQVSATELLRRVNALMVDMQSAGARFPVNPITGCCVGGESFGGFRPSSCPIGAPQSAHKMGEAVDLYDPLNELDNWITKNPSLLVKYDLYREHPQATNHWLHLSTRAPKSGSRTFLP